MPIHLDGHACRIESVPALLFPFAIFQHFGSVRLCALVGHPERPDHAVVADLLPIGSVFDESLVFLISLHPCTSTVAIETDLSWYWMDAPIMEATIATPIRMLIRKSRIIAV
jgi:hypothetical protein